MIKIGFFISRTAQYRSLGALILEAGKNHDFQVTHILGSPEIGRKSHLSPNQESVPKIFIEKGDSILVAPRDESMEETLKDFDVVVSTLGRSVATKGLFDQSMESPFWVAVEDARHSSFPTHRLDDADLICWASEQTFLRAKELLKSSYWTQKFGNEEIEQRFARLEQRSHFTGWLRGDNLKALDKKALKREWGIPEDQPVVLYNPDAFRTMNRFDREKDGQAYDMHTELYRLAWCESGCMKRLQNFFKTKLNKFEFLKWFAGEEKMLRAIRDFCDRNNAFLLMQRRRLKDFREEEYIAFEKKIQDGIVPEREDFPQSYLMACGISEVLISPYAGASYADAATAGIPYLFVKLPDKCFAPETLEEYEDHYPEDLFDSPGVSWTIDADTFVKTFGNQTILDYKISKEQHQTYVKKYLGFNDGKCGERILQLIQVKLAKTEAKIS